MHSFVLAILNNCLSSFPIWLSVLCIWPVFVLLSVFMSRFCSSPSLCLFLQICNQTPTINSARESTRRPKVCRYALTYTHAHTFSLSLTHTDAYPPHLRPSVLSRSLQSVDEVQDIPPPSLPLLSVSKGFEALCSLTEKLWPQTDRPTTNFPSSHHQDPRHCDDHWSHSQEERDTKESKLACQCSIRMSSLIAFQHLFLTVETEWGVEECICSTTQTAS